MKTYLGVELGSTRMKAVLLNAQYQPESIGEFAWESNYENGVWTYPLELVWEGLCHTLKQMHSLDTVVTMGISGMMHGYLAFDRDWNLLVPFRTWRNTITGRAAKELSAAFGFNIPQRWSIAHLYQAMLNGEEHVSKIAHITTLAGYVHYKLTGENVVGIGEASGMFPIDSDALDYHAQMLDRFDEMAADMPWSIREILPRVAVAGTPAGTLTAQGAGLLDGMLQPGICFAPPEGDAGTGMVATNAVAPRTGNVSAGTSIFSMVVLEHPLREAYPEISMVTTPLGAPVAMVHCNNCTSDLNAWTRMMRETVELFYPAYDGKDLFSALFQKSLEGDADCGGITVCNYLAGEAVTHFDAGRPFVVRTPDSSFRLANFIRAEIYSALVTVSIGMEILFRENVAIDSLTGHGGLFKTPGVAQRYLAAACRAPVSCMELAGEGGPFGIALLAAYLDAKQTGISLAEFLNKHIFAEAKVETVQPDPVDVEGFKTYRDRFQRAIAMEAAAIENL